MIKLIDATKVYTSTHGLQYIGIDSLNISFPAEGFIVILGKSGSGKSTLLNILGGLDKLTTGKMIVSNQDTSLFCEIDWDNYRSNEVGFIFQEYNLLDNYDVKKNLSIPLEIQGYKKKKIDIKIEEVLRYVELLYHSNRKIGELSGGEKQRVAIARSLIKNPRIILADEPTGSLDEKTAETILHLLYKISKERLVVVVTHDKDIAYKYANKIIYVSDGKITDEFDNDYNISEEIQYKINVYDNNLNKLKSILVNSEPNLIREIQKIYRDKKDHFLNITSKIEDKKYTPKIEENIDDIEVTNNKLPIYSVLKMAFSSLKEKKVRLLMIIFAFGLSLALLFSIVTIKRYSNAYTIGKFFEDKSINEINVYDSNCYMNEIFHDVCKNLRTGSYMVKLLDSTFGEESLIGVVNDYDIVHEMPYFEPISISLKILNNLEYLNNFDIVGQKPVNSHDIVVTDNIIYRLFGKDSNLSNYLNYQITSTKQEQFNITGIINTSNLDTNSLGDGDDFKNSIFISHLYINDLKDNIKTINVPGSNLYLENKSLVREIRYSAYDQDITILYGEIPVSKNQVVVSAQFVSNLLGMDYYSLIDKTYSIDYINEVLLNKNYEFNDIYHDDYHKVYYEYINMKNFFQEGVRITGIFDENNLNYSIDIMVDEKIFDSLKEYYFDGFYLDDIIVIKPRSLNYHEFSLLIENKALIIDNPYISEIYNFGSSLENIQTIIRYLFIVITLITSLLISSYISFKIDNHQRHIGILRALGVRAKDIIYIFIFETMLISILSFLLALLSFRYFLILANDIFRNPSGYSNMYDFDILYFKQFDIIITLIFSIALGLLSAIWSIVKLNKLKPIEIINR